MAKPQDVRWLFAAHMIGVLIAYNLVLVVPGCVIDLKVHWQIFMVPNLMPHKIILCLLVIVSTASQLRGQSKEVVFLVDTTISIMKNNMLDPQRMDWKQLSQNAHAKAKGINNPYGLGPVMRYLYRSINDFHGAFFYRDSVFQWQKRVIVSDSIRNEWNKGVVSKTAILDEDIGYLRIPSMPVATQEDFNTRAQTLNDSLCLLLQKKVKGIILDLRLNGGGAMHPMILGLEQLLDFGVVGSFRTRKRQDWILKDNGFYVDTSLFSHINPLCWVDARAMPVVMLIGSQTGSAGELLVLAFKGRKNTVLLGTPTAGFVTVNSGIPINDTAFMNLSIGYSADTNGKVYTTSIKPDIVNTSIDKFKDIENDEKIKAAIRWLRLQIK